MRRKLVGLVVVAMMLALPVLAQTSLTLPFQVIHGAPGSEVVLYSGPMPVVGESCEVTASSSGNNQSVHPDNDLVLESGGESIIFEDVERAVNVSTSGSGSIVPGNTGTVTLTLGPDRRYSANLILEFKCNSTTTSTIGTTTTLVESTTTTTTPSETTTSSSVSTTISTPSSSIPESSSTAPTFTTLAFTGSETDDEVALGIAFAGVGVLILLVVRLVWRAE